jgi:hypothetical protein
MDLFLAIHKANGQFVRLNYGLVPPSRLTTSQEEYKKTISINDSIGLLTRSDWQNSNSAFRKASITIGTFVISD